MILLGNVLSLTKYKRDLLSSQSLLVFLITFTCIHHGSVLNNIIRLLINENEEKLDFYALKNILGLSEYDDAVLGGRGRSTSMSWRLSWST